MKPPPKLPTLTEVVKIKTKGTIPKGAWPCPECDAVGCNACKGSGMCKRSVFIKWYGELCEKRKEWLKRYQDWLDDQAVETAGEDLYDLSRLRRIDRR